jgi:hypothetical protein
MDVNDTLDVVLCHQIDLFNILLRVIKDSLRQLENGLKGLIVMGEDLELLTRSILANKIPELWRQSSYPSILTLRNYIDDLVGRVRFLDDWIRIGRPALFKLSAFYHPEEFLTAVLQAYARKHSVPFDSLTWTSSIVEADPTKLSPPSDGVYLEGLFLEGAKWENGKLADCGATELISVLPIVYLCPRAEKAQVHEGFYECPVYRTQNRGTGALDLPNYIMSLYLSSGQVSPDHWIQRSVAVFITV